MGAGSPSVCRMSKYWLERNWKTDGTELNRRQATNRLERIARESQQQEDAQIEGWLKIADDFIESHAKPLHRDGDAEPEIA